MTTSYLASTRTQRLAILAAEPYDLIKDWIVGEAPGVFHPPPVIPGDWLRYLRLNGRHGLL
jgi:hypothetical protein